MPLLILLLVIVVADIAVLVLVGQFIGVLGTFGLLVAAGLLGGWIVRREGRRTLQELSEAARSRRPSNRELSESVFIVIGGALIVLPGYVSDVAGLLLLLPPVRRALRQRVQRAAERRAEQMREQVQEQAFTFYGPHLHAQYGTQDGGAANARRQDESSDDVIEGEVVSVQEDEQDASPEPELPPRAQSRAEDDRR